MRDLELRQGIVDNIIYSSSLISGMIVYPAEGDPLSFGGDQYLEISDSIAPIINEIQNQEYYLYRIKNICYTGCFSVPDSAMLCVTNPQKIILKY